MKKAFKGIYHGTGQIDLSHHKDIEQFLPVEIHLKEDGTVDNKPSFAIVLTSPYSRNQVVGQISLEMLNQGLADLGYEIKKTVKKNLFAPITEKNNDCEKVVRDGKVAVLVSGGFGAGWYSWNSDYPQLLFHPKLVELVEAGKQDEITADFIKDIFDIDIYCGGAKDLSIHWLPVGTAFEINEHDGSESLNTMADLTLIA